MASEVPTLFAGVISWVLSAIFASTGELPGFADLPDGTALVRKLLREAPLSFKLAVYATTLVFICAPLLTVKVPLPAFLLARRSLDLHAHRMAGHRLYLVRQSALMLKTVGGTLWGGHPLVRQRLGLQIYAPDPGTHMTGAEHWQALRDAGQVKR